MTLKEWLELFVVVVGVVIVVAALRHGKRSKITRAILAYAALALSFATMHFVVYKLDPDAYWVDESLKARATRDAATRSADSIKATVSRISFVDAALLSATSQSSYVGETFEFDSSAPKEYRQGPLIIKTTVHLDVSHFVGPDKHVETSNYGLVDFRFAEDYKGIKAGSAQGYTFADFYPAKTGTLSGLQFRQDLVEARQREIVFLSVLFQPESSELTKFTPFEFCYLTFSVATASEMRANDGLTRFLVFAQLMLTLILAVALT